MDHSAKENDHSTDYHEEYQYLNLLKYIIDHGHWEEKCVWTVYAFFFAKW
jgi:hypothetical protein